MLNEFVKTNKFDTLKKKNLILKNAPSKVIPKD
jgi:hypothetical protein